jgi:hypothetical protein
MAETRGERIFMRGVPVFLGACFLVIAAAGTADVVAMRRGVKRIGTVQELVLDSHYRTTNYRRSEPYYRIRLAISDGSARRSVWAHASPGDVRDRAIKPGSLEPLIHDAVSGRTRLATEAPSAWVAILGCGVCIPLGLFLIGYGIWGKVPAFPRE